MWTLFFFFNDTATTEIYTLSLHDALPICRGAVLHRTAQAVRGARFGGQRPQRLEVELHPGDRAVGEHHAAVARSEEHTSELQSPCNLVCRLLLEKKKLHRQPSTTLCTLAH